MEVLSPNLNVNIPELYFGLVRSLTKFGPIIRPSLLERNKHIITGIILVKKLIMYNW